MLEDEGSSPSPAPTTDQHELNRKERAKLARQQAYRAAKERAAQLRQAAKNSPEALRRKEAQRERARAARKEAYARAKKKMVEERQSAKTASRTLKDEERQRKDAALRASLRLGSEVEPPERSAEDEAHATDAAPPPRRRAHLRLVSTQSED